MRFGIRSFWQDESGAIAAVYALALPALIAAGAVAFDYSRLVSMDTELQNAADQSALASATQLDKQGGACSRASAAAINLVSNNTLFANDGSGTDVTITSEPTCDAIGNIKFWQDKAKANAATSDSNALFVEVTVDARTAKYALTPIVAAYNSGAINATAMAGLGSAICKVPPVMICNPNETADAAFTTANYIGKGLKLVSVGNGGGAWAPGNFGYLDTGYPVSNPNTELRQALGWITAPGDCSNVIGVRTRTGAGTTVTQAINTRFDVYERANTNAATGKGNNGNGGNASCPTGGTCPPSINVIKDLVMKGTPANASKCGISNNEWELPAKPYLPASASADLATANLPNAMGHPRDKCHAVDVGTTDECTGPVGDGDWDANAYFKVNYNWTEANWRSATGYASPNKPTRYAVYQWEIANRGTSFSSSTVLPTGNQSVGGAYDRFARPICGPLQGYGANGSGMVPGGSTVDRRRISAAVLNCNANSVNGGSNTVYPVLKWIEFFLVEPSVNRDRTDANDVYVEVIGETTLAGSGGATAGQVTARDVPYLIE
jgi:Flp pilus assembly protein TadG